MAVNENIDVLSLLTSPESETGQNFNMSFNDLLNKSRSVRETLTLSLKSNFNDMTADELSGKGTTKITKHFLAESVLSLVRLVDTLEAKSNTELCNSSPNAGSKVSEFNEYLSSIQIRLNDYCDTINDNQQRFDSMVATLNQLITSCGDKPASNVSPSLEDTGLSPSSSAMAPNTASPHLSGASVCKPFVSYITNVLPDSLQTSLQTFIAGNESEFSNIGNSRDTLYFGECGYSGGEHKAKTMPPPLQELITLVKPHITDHTFNSCLITRYKSGSDHIPPHRDDEPLLNPESEIATVSIGGKRTMKFTNNSGQDSQELNLENGSLLVTSRFAQDYWLHSIEKTEEACDVRYSFTFRHIAPHFLNSAVIVGDSNTKYLKFGEGKGSFGKWMPGKRLEALHIESIPDATKIGPYRNVIIHTGINNIKLRNRPSNKTLGNILENKCMNILNAYPRSKIHLSLLLPTKLTSLNHVIRDFNSIMYEIAHSHKNIKIIDHPLGEYCDINGCLNDQAGRYDRESNAPLTQDTLHLGKHGLRILAKTLKSSVVGKFSGHPTRTGQQGPPTERVINGGHQPS